jgi:hypothetical protein
MFEVTSITVATNIRVTMMGRESDSTAATNVVAEYTPELSVQLASRYASSSDNNRSLISSPLSRATMASYHLR